MRNYSLKLGIEWFPFFTNVELGANFALLKFKELIKEFHFWKWTKIMCTFEDSA